MIRIQTAFLCIIFLFLSGHLLGQENIWSQPMLVSCRIGYAGNGTNGSVVSDEMIREIAADEVKHPRKIHFDVIAKMQIRISSTKGSDPIVEISFSKPRVKGNVYFRKFPVRDVLVPDRVDFTLRIEGKDSAASFFIFDIHNLKCTWNDSIILRRAIPAFFPGSDTVLTENLQFYYDKETLTPFRDRIRLINDYWAADAVLDTLQVKFRELDLGNIDRYPFCFVMLEEMNKMLAILDGKKFQQRLVLDSLDPLGFLEKYDKLSYHANSASMTFKENLKGSLVPALPFPLDQLSDEFLSGIRRYIRWSMLVSERNSKIYQDYLEHYFTTNAFGDDLEVMKYIAGKWFPGENADTIMAMVSRKINKECHDMADTLMQDQQFADAVELLAFAGRFSAMNPYIKESPADREVMVKAANGIYDSYMGIADGAIRYRKFDMAQTYLARAQTYRREHAAFVTSDSLFKKVFRELVSEKSSQCDTLYSNGLYQQALECYSELGRGFDSLTRSLINSGIEEKKMYCNYKLLIEKGMKNLAAKDKPEAGRNFFLARQISTEGQFPPDSVFDSLCRAFYPYYLIHLLYAGEERIWTNRLESARQFADSVAFIQRTTGVESSRELSDVLARYRRKVEERICWNANESVEVFLLRAETERQLKDFILAAALADSAVSVAHFYSDCVIPLPGVKDTAFKYREALEFQRIMRKADVFVSAGKYKEAIAGYIELEDYFRSHEISPFGLTLQPMYDYIRSRSIRELTFQALLYFEDKKDPESAFRYLKLLRIQDYPRKSVKEPMEWLGNEYARKDFAFRPEQDPLSLVRDYTGRDKWMKSFRVEYYKEAATLRNQPGIKYLFRKLFP
ncbi:MAG: hypothetical protein NTU98_00820 [Bacteroidetes bacterium]|nr:hypothetical protein [Bacteroidota bacterium]